VLDATDLPFWWEVNTASVRRGRRQKKKNEKKKKTFCLGKGGKNLGKGKKTTKRGAL